MNDLLLVLRQDVTPPPPSTSLGAVVGGSYVGGCLFCSAGGQEGFAAFECGGTRRPSLRGLFNPFLAERNPPDLLLGASDPSGRGIHHQGPQTEAPRL